MSMLECALPYLTWTTEAARRGLVSTLSFTAVRAAYSPMLFHLAGVLVVSVACCERGGDDAARSLWTLSSALLSVSAAYC